jgi:Na+/proline symporter
MRSLDWVVVVYLVWIVYDGLRRSKGTDKVDGYFREPVAAVVGGRPSVMATQMSAVTIVGTTGRHLTGLRFIQFYFGLPLR